MYLNDRMRTEQALLSQLMCWVVIHGVSEIDLEEGSRVIELLRVNTESWVMGMPPGKRDAILRRSKRTYDRITAALFVQDGLVAKAGLVLYFTMKELQERGYTVVVDNSAFDQALAVILPGLEYWANQEALAASARKQGLKMLTMLHDQEGFFQGVDLG